MKVTIRKTKFSLTVTEWLASPGGTKFSKLLEGISKEELSVFLKWFYTSSMKKDDTSVHEGSSITST